MVDTKRVYAILWTLVTAPFVVLFFLGMAFNVWWLGAVALLAVVGLLCACMARVYSFEDALEDRTKRLERDILALQRTVDALLDSPVGAWARVRHATIRNDADELGRN